MNKFIKILLISLIVLTTYSCNYKKIDQRERPTDPKERRRQAVDEGRGFGLSGLMKNRSTNYEFSTANPLWRASLETLEFIPLNTVDYSGGTIISDWYSEGNASGKESLKISVRFLSNEIRSDSLRIIVHKKICSTETSCRTSLLANNSKVINELRSVILRKASTFEKESKQKIKKK